jgi:hemolysin activation/secretion protein
MATPLPGAQVDVTGAELRGSTVYPPGRFADLLESLRGSVDQTRIEEVRAAILAAYRADGYVFSAVTAAMGAKGDLVFTAIEGRIVDVKLDGDIGPAGVQVLRFLNRLTETAPLNVATLERWLLLAQDVPGVTLRTVLRPSAGDPGALSLVAQVSRARFSGLAAADNRAYKGTGPEEVLLSVSGNSFTEYGERTDASLFWTARSTEIFGQISTEFFLGASGLKVRFYGGKGTIDPTGSLGQIGYHGNTGIAGASLSYPVIRRRQQSLNLGVFFDAMQSSIDTGTNGNTVLASQDNLRVVRLGADYALRDVLLGDERSAVSIASLRVSQGLAGLGASIQGSKLAGRVGENISFTKVSFEASRTQVLFNPGQNTSVALQGLLAGQYSGDILPPAEKFYLGGLRWNRGFYSGQVTGDSALTASVEAQLNTTFDVRWPEPFELGTQFYAFYDWGETWESQKIDQNHRLVSLGTGARMYFPKNIEIDVEGVVRLTRQPLGTSTFISPLPETAAYWRVISRF